MHDLPEWLEEFADTLVDGEASSPGEAFARRSHESLHPKLPPKVVSGKHSTSLETEIAKYAKGPK